MADVHKAATIIPAKPVILPRVASIQYTPAILVDGDGVFCGQPTSLRHPYALYFARFSGRHAERTSIVHACRSSSSSC